MPVLFCKPKRFLDFLLSLRDDNLLPDIPGDLTILIEQHFHCSTPCAILTIFKSYHFLSHNERLQKKYKSSSLFLLNYLERIIFCPPATGAASVQGIRDYFYKEEINND